MVVGDGECRQFVEGQFLVAVGLHQLGADRAKLEPLPDHGRRAAEPRSDVLCRHAFLAIQLGERLELVGGVHAEADYVFSKADLMGVVRGVENAAHRLGLLDLLALGAKQMRKPPAFADGDKVIARLLVLAIAFRLDHKILQQALGGDARGQGFDVCLRMRRLSGILR